MKSYFHRLIEQTGINWRQGSGTVSSSSDHVLSTEPVTHLSNVNVDDIIEVDPTESTDFPDNMPDTSTVNSSPDNNIDKSDFVITQNSSKDQLTSKNDIVDDAIVIDEKKREREKDKEKKKKSTLPSQAQNKDAYGRSFSSANIESDINFEDKEKGLIKEKKDDSSGFDFEVVDRENRTDFIQPRKKEDTRRINAQHNGRDMNQAEDTDASYNDSFSTSKKEIIKSAEDNPDYNNSTAKQNNTDPQDNLAFIQRIRDLLNRTPVSNNIIQRHFADSDDKKNDIDALESDDEISAIKIPVHQIKSSSTIVDRSDVDSNEVKSEIEEYHLSIGTINIDIEGSDRDKTNIIPQSQFESTRSGSNNVSDSNSTGNSNYSGFRLGRHYIRMR